MKLQILISIQIGKALINELPKAYQNLNDLLKRKC